MLVTRLSARLNSHQSLPETAVPGANSLVVFEEYGSFVLEVLEAYGSLLLEVEVLEAYGSLLLEVEVLDVYGSEAPDVVPVVCESAHCQSIACLAFLARRCVILEPVWPSLPRSPVLGVVLELSKPEVPWPKVEVAGSLVKPLLPPVAPALVAEEPVPYICSSSFSWPGELYRSLISMIVHIPMSMWLKLTRSS